MILNGHVAVKLGYDRCIKIWRIFILPEMFEILIKTFSHLKLTAEEKIKETASCFKSKKLDQHSILSHSEIQKINPSHCTNIRRL